MSTKTIVTAASVVVALGLGFYVGQARYAEQPLTPLPPTPEHMRALAALRQENEQLKAETDRLTAANAALATAAARSVADAPAPASRPAAAAPLPTAPLPALVRINQQRAIMNNLRQLSAARDQFIREYKRPPMSLDELVGPTKYVRALTPVAGESYAAVALDAKQPLTVTGPDGQPLTYDPAGKQTTNLERESIAASEEAMQLLTARFGAEFVLRMQTSIQKAVAAYAAANGGKRPSAPDAALPFFPTPQDGADFVEFSEAAKAIGMRF